MYGVAGDTAPFEVQADRVTARMRINNRAVKKTWLQILRCVICVLHNLINGLSRELTYLLVTAQPDRDINFLQINQSAALI
jgi:hypothetical protein